MIPTSWLGRRFVYNLSLPGRDRYVDGVSLLPACVRERSLFSNEFLASARYANAPYARFNQHLQERPSSDPLSEVLYLDAKTYLPGDILTKVDRMSMATSLEVRAPLLDHVFAEWSARLSPRWKVRNGESKYILKKLAERLGVPREAIYREKKGFAMPLVHWFRQKPQPALLDILLEPRTLQRGYLNPRGVRNLLREHCNGVRDRSAELWNLLIFELWHRNFLEPTMQVRSRSVSPTCVSTALNGFETAAVAHGAKSVEVAQ
jgi:asparagine synthase (glutamine-hydrolysing)